MIGEELFGPSYIVKLSAFSIVWKELKTKLSASSTEPEQNVIVLICVLLGEV